MPDSLPLLLMGGTRDGVIANNTQLYGMTEKDPIYSNEHNLLIGYDIPISLRRLRVVVIYHFFTSH